MGVMSLKKTTYVTTRFKIYGGFFVDVVNNEKTNYVDFSLGRENDSTKMDMFSIPAKNCPESKWEGYIEGNVEEYIATYLEEQQRRRDAEDDELY